MLCGYDVFSFFFFSEMGTTIICFIYSPLFFMAEYDVYVRTERQTIHPGTY